MTQPKFSMFHKADLYEEEIIDGFAIYAFLSYSDCEESARQHEGLDDTEEDETITVCKRTPSSRKRASSGYRSRHRSRSDSRSSIGDAGNGSIYLENGNNLLLHRSVIKRKAGRPKKGPKVQIKHEIYSDLSDPSIDAQQLNCLYNDYLQDLLKKEEEHRYEFTMPQSMDENFVNLSLNALDSSFKRDEPLPEIDSIKKELDTNDEIDDYDQKRDLTGKIPADRASENDGDLTEMISRHPKREIRLPARYHQSGLLMGSQWIVADYNPDEKVTKKKIKIEESDEQKHAQHQHQHQPLKPHVTSLEQTEHFRKSDQSQMRSTLQQHYQHEPPPQLPPQPPSQSPTPSLLLRQPNHQPYKMLKPQPHQSQKQQQSHLKPLYSCENQRIISYNNSIISSDLDTTKDDDKSLSSDLCNESIGSVNNANSSSKLNSPSKACPQHVSQLKLHQEKLDRLQFLRKQQEINGKLRENITTINYNLKDYSLQDPSVPKNIVTSTVLSTTNNIHPSPSPSSPCSSPSQSNQQNVSVSNSSTYSNQSSSNSSSPNADNSVPPALKGIKLQELRQLYRDLYFENKPERRLIYAKNRVKPRVNKKLEVEEAIRVIQKLTKREKQLEYIKKLLTMWNKKLTLAEKVISDKDVIPKAVDVVRDVLKTYQSSKSYRVAEAWDSLTKPKTSLAINSNPSNRILKPELTSRSGSFIIKNNGPSLMSRIIVNPETQANPSTESRVSSLTVMSTPATSTSTLTSSSTLIRTTDHSKPTEKTSTANKAPDSSSRIIKKHLIPPIHPRSSDLPPHHLHIHPSVPLPLPPPPPSISLPPPPPSSLHVTLPLTQQAHPSTHQLSMPPLPSCLPTPHSYSPSPALHPSVQQQISQTNFKPIPLLINPGTLNHNNLFSSTRGYGRHKPSEDLCPMPRAPLANTVTPISPVVTSPGVTTKPTIIKPTTFLLAPNAASPTSPVYRILVKSDTINRVRLVTPLSSNSSSYL